MDSIGKLIDATAQRDAIHVAIAPVVAAMTLQPGCHVGFVDDGCENVTAISEKLIGIVDPFLGVPVKRGERFWLFLYPNTVTSMRHDWKHPAFTGDKTYSEQWLRDCARNINTYDEPEVAYQSLVEGLRKRSIRAHGTELYSIRDLENADELKKHAEIVLGIRIDWENFSFSCGC